ncbi:MAG: septal ring lytic transglycosylase RlpA family protein [Bacteroidaceae bacterium]|nr:septal ring lytic transglycosylase RlpA family protein [Bacteroidaceae bacterium]
MRLNKCFIYYGVRIFLFAVALFSVSDVCSQQLKPQKGNASYYHDRFHGRTMSNGEPYNKDSLTCAHLKYPMGTKLLVRNLTNGKEVVVTVTDRGPYTRKFVIDLSRAAARELDIIQYGFRPVEIIPFKEGVIPFKYIPSKDSPELDLGYSTDRSYGPPFWQEDSIYVANIKHKLRTTLRSDTTLRHRAVKSAIKKRRMK